MRRILLAGIVGAIIYFIWGMAAWMVIPLHTPTMSGLSNQEAFRELLRGQDLPTGVYVVPWSNNAEDWEQPESEFARAHQDGPLVTIFFTREGAEIMPPGLLASGFSIDLLAALLAAWLLSLTLPGNPNYLCRVGFVLGLGIFVALIGHASYWNWMRFPADYTLAFVVDVIVGWTLAGLGIAAIMRPEPQPAHREPAVQAAPRTPESQTSPAAKPSVAAPATMKVPIRNDAITLLATLQREARLVDIVKEPLAQYSDAQVGAAARDVLRDCGAVLDRLFDLRPMVTQEEGSTVEIPKGFDAGRYRITGDATRAAPLSASLVHPGWQAQCCNLPQWTGSKDTAMIVAPVEVEVK